MQDVKRITLRNIVYLWYIFIYMQIFIYPMDSFQIYLIRRMKKSYMLFLPFLSIFVPFEYVLLNHCEFVRILFLRWFYYGFNDNFEFMICIASTTKNVFAQPSSPVFTIAFAQQNINNIIIQIRKTKPRVIYLL